MSEQTVATTAPTTQAQGDGQAAKTQAATPQSQTTQQASQSATGQTPDTSGLDAIKKELATSREQTAKLQEQLNLVERQQAEKGGDLKKVLKMEQESKAKIQAELDNLKTSMVKTKVRSAIQEKAKDAHNVDHLMKLGDVDKITVVDGTVYGVDEFLGGLRKEAPHLFKVQDVNAGPKVGPTVSIPKDKENYYKELDKQTTAAGVAAVRKKYGVDSGADKLLVDGRIQ